MNPVKKIPEDLHEERGKWIPCALLAALAMALPAAPYLLSIAEARPSAPPSIHKVSLLRETPAQPAPPRPKPEPKPKPEPEKKPAPAKPTVAEIALKQVQASLTAEKEKQAEKKRKKKEREEKEKQKKEAEQKKREAAEKKRKKEEAQKRAEELAKAARQREKEAAAARAREAEKRAAELRAQATAAVRAAEAARLSDLRGIYLGRIKAQIESRLDTPVSLLERDDVVVEIKVFLHPDGDLKGWPQVTRPSGFPEYDEAAIRAVIQAAPLVVPSDEPGLLEEFLQLDLRIRPQ